MKQHNIRQIFLGFLLLWFVVNLGQAIFTGIHSDEVYYALWGRNLDWGYFDHPPAVAVLTYLGGLFFDGNLGVRFFTLLMHLGTVSLVWFTLDEKHRQSRYSVLVFFTIMASLTMFSVYAFTTTPDAPLVFFVAIFLFAHRRFLEQSQWWQALLMAVAMAGMLYSKYHGALFIGFVVLSNIKILLNLRFWVAGILALLMLTPHFYWQYANDFSSIKFHLVARSLGFQVKYVLEFIPGQLGVFNPFTLGVVLYSIWKYKAQNSFERTLYFLIIGVIGFFALSTYKGRAEAHWTSMASVPMLILLSIRAMEQEKIKKYVLKYVLGSLVLILIARIILLTEYSRKFGYENLEERYRAVEKMAGNRPVVFNSSFQDPAFYEFYTKKPSTTISSMETRQTQYDFWQKEQEMLEKPVLIIMGENSELEQKFEKHLIAEDFVGFFVKDWQISNRLKVNYQLTKNRFRRGEWVEIPIEIENPTRQRIDFKHKDFPINLKVVFLILKRDYVVGNAEFSVPLGELKPFEMIKGKLRFRIPEELANREYKFSVISYSPFGHTLNSAFENIEIRK